VRLGWELVKGDVRLSCPDCDDLCAALVGVMENGLGEVLECVQYLRF